MRIYYACFYSIYLNFRDKAAVDTLSKNDVAYEFLNSFLEHI